jgi:cytochrome d ubiquinol oxidase subunit II
VAFLRAFHLVLAGIGLRGAAFVFRTYRTHIGGAPRTWSCVFAIASTLPGATGDHPWCDRDRGLRVVDGVVQPFAGVS